MVWNTFADVPCMFGHKLPTVLDATILKAKEFLEKINEDSDVKTVQNKNKLSAQEFDEFGKFIEKLKDGKKICHRLNNLKEKGKKLEMTWTDALKQEIGGDIIVTFVSVTEK